MTSLNQPTVLHEFLEDTRGPREAHEHEMNCAITFQQPALTEFWANDEMNARMQRAGLWSLLKFEFPTEQDAFLQSILFEFTPGADDTEILCSPSILGRWPGRQMYAPEEYAPIIFYGVHDLQRHFPGLPSRHTHRDTIELAPPHTDGQWLRSALTRYFAVPILWTSPRGAEFVMIESCFNIPFFLFLQKLSFVFGWAGYPDKFPRRHFPMAVMSFERGAHYPWADLMFADLMKDLIKYQNRLRPCPRMIRIWALIYDEVVMGRVPESESNPQVWEFLPLLYESRRNGWGFSQFHYHAEDISYFTPPMFVPLLRESACPGPPTCPDPPESDTEYSEDDVVILG